MTGYYNNDCGEYNIKTATEQKPNYWDIIKYFKSLTEETVSHYKYFYIQCSEHISECIGKSYWDWGLCSSNLELCSHNENNPDFYNTKTVLISDFINYDPDKITALIDEIYNSYIKGQKKRIIVEKMNKLKGDFK